MRIITISIMGLRKMVTGYLRANEVGIRGLLIDMGAMGATLRNHSILLSEAC